MFQNKWIDIPWYEWLYSINIHTQAVKSISRIHKWFWYIKKELILKPNIRKDWYYSFSLCKWDKINREYLHRLVMLIKEWPCPEWMEVCHNDGNPRNNHPDNLRYWTREENVQDSKKHWTIFEIKNVKPDTSKSCFYSYWTKTFTFLSAKEMAKNLWIPHWSCTSLIRKTKTKYWKFKWYIFWYH